MVNEQVLKEEFEELQNLISQEFKKEAVINIKDKIEERGLVKTGELRDSIEIKSQNIGPCKTEQTVVMKEYGEYLELGTPTLQPQRFVRDGLKETANDLENNI